MGLEDVIDVTDDIGTADAILATGSEIRQNPWIRGVAKFHHVPVFVIKVPSCCFFSFSFSVNLLMSCNKLLFLSVQYHGSNGQGSTNDPWARILWPYNK